ncbi:PREDICTED: pygopus homolog 2-like [Amphimedon queenslandica]|uniref:PHD-type domain-containing protein n=1 Tax=Amphimedon queenslandica TaxID=400682 RepID=A0A1X7V8K9_AMPQE|nr:PREDICTED: pygopus homolog 2-like [Amphimedon queenslandica]|eukprot:XP_003385401.1 PREDICTED: pygopus homolog 2-like [Amphimedon queenslandica]
MSDNSEVEEEEDEELTPSPPPPLKDFPCGICFEEVKDEDEGILCESGCDKWYHRQCAGMSKNAYDLLTREDSAEWACDTCIKKNNIPMTKMVPIT